MKSSLFSKVKESKFYLPLLAISSGLLMWLGWPTMPLPIFLFIGFIPLFEIEFQTTKNKQSTWVFFGNIYLGLLVWNALTTWWIWNASEGGAVFAILANTLLMTIPFFLYRLARKTVHQKLANISFVAFWIGFEFVHLNWDLTWPWITLGNGLAMTPDWIQWYEYTGVLGGSFWILFINILLFNAFKKRYFSKEFLHIGAILLIALFLIIPLTWSYFAKRDLSENSKNTIEVVLIQPNIDPYNGKFKDGKDFIPYEDQVKMMIVQAEKTVTSETKYLVLPETAIQGGHRESNFQTNDLIQLLRDFLEKHPQISIVSGIESWNQLNYTKENAPTYTRFHPQIGYYASYNTAIQIEANTKDVQVYHKSKFVPGVEKLPYPAVLGFILDIIDFDQAGMYGDQKERTPFKKDSLQIAPLICYESIFGEFTGKFVKNGANAIFIITNDGWWQETAGHKHHNLYARLRAIETRRMVARSANTGISSFIDENGTFIQESKWWGPVALKQKIRTSDELTFYVKHGDYIGRVCGFFSVLLLISIFVRRKTK